MNKRYKITIIIFSWLAVLITMLVIARFSLQTSSDSSSTSEIFLKLIPFYDRLSPSVLDIFHTIIRKLAHFTIYALLGFCAFNAYSVTLKIKNLFLCLLSVGISSTYATIDEFVFQALAEGRAPMLFDVFIDTLGALFGSVLMLMIFLLVKLNKKRKP